MIKIKPNIELSAACPYCHTSLKPVAILWQGIHVCAKSTCEVCKIELIADLPVGHSMVAPCIVDLTAKRLFLDDVNSLSWYGKPFFQSLENPEHSIDVNMVVDGICRKKTVIILNCIDYLYGHSLLKLLNIGTLLGSLNSRPELGIIVIVPSFLRWMVPQGACEIWTVNIPLSKAQKFYPRLNELIIGQCERFEEIFVSKAHSHPKYFDIQKFTSVQRHDMSSIGFRITFIWREDRLWHNDLIHPRLARVGPLNRILLIHQNYKVRRLLKLIRKQYPHAKYTVSGLGRRTKFPKWIDDKRVALFNERAERALCRVYAESRLIVGVHGSNMLLPSAHAGMTIDLMPNDRWGNIAQDILYQESDSRLVSYIYRYLPSSISLKTLTRMISVQIRNYSRYKMRMSDELMTDVDG